MEIDSMAEKIRRICNQGGVSGIVITNRDGSILESTLDLSTTQQYVSGIVPFESRVASAIREIDPTNQLNYILIRTKTHQIILKTEESYLLYVIQNPTG